MLGPPLTCNSLPWQSQPDTPLYSHCCTLNPSAGGPTFVLVSPCRTHCALLSGAPAGGGSASPTPVALPWQHQPASLAAAEAADDAPPPTLLSACLCMEDMLVLFSTANDVVFYAAAAPWQPLATLSLPASSPVVHACCSTTRLLGCGPGRPYAPDMLYLTLGSGDAVSCSWPALRQCALDTAAAAAAGTAPAFNAWSFSGPHRYLGLAVPTNPCGNTLFDSFDSPADLFSNARLGGAAGGAAGPSPAPDTRQDVLVTGGQAPALASYTAPITRPTNELAAMASSVGKALRSTLSGFATRLLGPELKTGLGSALGGGLRRALQWTSAPHASPAAAAAGGGEGSGGAGVPGAALPPLPPHYTLPLDFSLEDGQRCVTSLTPDPTGRYVLAGDSWGRVMLLDAGELVILRLWKGYRDASLGWVCHREAASGRALLAPVILAPRRGLLEVWHPRAGPRLHSLRVPQGSALVYSVQWGGGEAFPAPLCHVLLPAGGSSGQQQGLSVQQLLPPAV